MGLVIDVDGLHPFDLLEAARRPMQSGFFIFFGTSYETHVSHFYWVDELNMCRASTTIIQLGIDLGFNWFQYPCPDSIS
ncbi:hypothetical protein GBA52_007363 [Prunus armeniaca]|nr:hypothetical protein GBA52_007363 [Prunus armeniaca]